MPAKQTYLTLDGALQRVSEVCRGRRHAFANDPPNRYAIDMLAWMQVNRRIHSFDYIAGSLDAMLGIAGSSLKPQIASACFMIAEIIKHGGQELEQGVADQIVQGAQALDEMLRKLEQVPA